jgi:hypothetical protein
MGPAYEASGKSPNQNMHFSRTISKAHHPGAMSPKLSGTGNSWPPHVRTESLKHFSIRHLKEKSK